MKKDLYDYFAEVEDDLSFGKKKIDNIEREQQRIRKQALLDIVYEKENNANDNYYNKFDEMNYANDNYNENIENKYDNDLENNNRNQRNVGRINNSASTTGNNRNYNRNNNRNNNNNNRINNRINNNKSPKKCKNENKSPKKKRSLWKKILLIIIAILLIILGLLYWKYTYLDSNTSIDIETNNSTGLRYTNIALFGLDSREGEIEDGVRSDTIIIASIDNLTHNVNIVSVLRDNFFQIGNEDLDKVNAAFSYGGAKLATETLNKNLDLDIENYMVINFTALIKAVDAVGGIDLNMTSDEVFWLNGYQLETAQTCGLESEVFDLPLQDGIQHVNGVQATAYCRVRYVGTDVARTNRQRIVLKALFDQVKYNPLKLNNMLNETFPHISTNMSYPRFASLGLFMPFYSLDKSESFPYDAYPTDNIPGYSGSYVIPNSLETNVVKLHKSLFNDNNYTASSTVKNISDNISSIMGY